MSNRNLEEVWLSFKTFNNDTATGWYFNFLNTKEFVAQGTLISGSVDSLSLPGSEVILAQILGRFASRSNV